MKKTKLLFAPILIMPFLLGCGGGPKEYTITWENWDKTVLAKTKVKQDELPKYEGETPTKPADAQYTYTFDGWTPEIDKATEDATYTATFTSDVIKYKVTFKNYDGTVLQESDVAADTLPVYTGKTPTKPSDDKFYLFKDWDKEITKPTSDTVYTATFEEYEICASLTVDASIDQYVKFTLEEDATIDVVDWGDGSSDKLTKHTYTDETEHTINISSTSTTFSIQSANVTSINLSNQITSIGNSAFAGCSNLKTINIPDSVTYIECCAFDECTSLQYEEEDGLKYLGNETNPHLALIGFSENKATYTINSDCKIIGGEAFYGNESLTSINIPDSVISIGSYAFQECPLTSIIIPSYVDFMGECVFYEWSSLNDLPIYCKAESKPDGWNDDWSETGDPEAGKLKVYWGYVSNGSYDNKFNYIVQKFNNIEQISITEYTGDKAATSITIPSTIKVGNDDLNVTSIGAYAFYYNTTLQTITLPNNLTSIGDSAFYGCTSLTGTIDIPNVTTIGNFAFYNATAITSVTNTDNLLSIGDDAFAGCDNLSSMTIPNTIVSIGESAFYDCSLLGTVKDNVRYVGNDTNSYLALISTEDWEATEYTIEETCRIIVGWVFNYHENMTSITIPNSVESIGNMTFDSCTSLTTVDLSNVNHLITAGYSIFYECTALEKIKVKDEELAERYRAAPGWNEYADIIVPATE